jgi:hypothetical protein
MKAQLTYETFDTNDEAERFATREKLKDFSILWNEDWFCWVVWYK